MSYTPFQQMSTLNIMTLVCVVAAIVCMSVSLASYLLSGEKTKKVGNIAFFIGIPLAVAAFGLVIFAGVTGSTPDARKDAYLRDAATGLSETYGIEVTEQNIKEMEYPTGEQDERRYFGTAAVKTGPEVNDFITARLAYDNGKVYLLKQVGEEDYEELEPVR